jgi:hypothetical protein
MPRPDGSPPWDPLRGLRDLMYKARVTVTCQDDQHVLAHVTLLADEAHVTPEGPVQMTPGDEPLEGVWSDGQRLELAFFSGLLHLSSDGEHARFWEAPCAQCERGTAAPRISWAQLRRLADHAAEHGGQLRVALPAGGLPGC